MILDNELELVEGPAGSIETGFMSVVGAGPFLGNHVQDARAAGGRDWAAGEEIFPYLKVGTAINNLTSMQVDIIASDNSDGTGNAQVLSTKTILLAALVAGALIPLPSLYPGGFYRRYLVAKFTITGTAPGTGTVRCGLLRALARPQEKATNL